MCLRPPETFRVPCFSLLYFPPGEQLFAYNTREHLYRRFAVVVNFLAVGRSGECSRSTFNRTYWNYDGEFLVLDWNELKTGRQKLMPFMCDAESMEIDFFHACACYFMFGRGEGTYVPESANWLFPKLAMLGSGACTKVSNLSKIFIKLGFFLCNFNICWS